VRARQALRVDGQHFAFTARWIGWRQQAHQDVTQNWATNLKTQGPLPRPAPGSTCTYDYQGVGECFKTAQGQPTNFLNNMAVSYALGGIGNCATPESGSGDAGGLARKGSMHGAM
jgi:hypothetical protein